MTNRLVRKPLCSPQITWDDLIINRRFWKNRRFFSRFRTSLMQNLTGISMMDQGPIICTGLSWEQNRVSLTMLFGHRSLTYAANNDPVVRHDLSLATPWTLFLCPIAGHGRWNWPTLDFMEWSSRIPRWTFCSTRMFFVLSPKIRNNEEKWDGLSPTRPEYAKIELMAVVGRSPSASWGVMIFATESTP